MRTALRYALVSLAALALPAACLAQTVPAADCAPAGRLALYVAAGPAEGRAWDSVTFATPTGPLTVTGRTCMQHYAPKEGAAALSDADIQLRYRAALQRAGATVVLADAGLTLARAAAGDWVRIASQSNAIDVLVVAPGPHRQVLTTPGTNDFAPLGHMPDYLADPPDRRAFDQRGFQVRDGDETREVVVQGARTEIAYALREGGRPASDADIQENYRNALRGAGGEILFTDERNTTARIERSGQAIWIKVWSEESAINVTVVEQAAHRLTLLPPSGHDDRRLGRMPGYAADPPERHSLDEVIFTLQDGDAVREVKVQGARTEITYAPKPGRVLASDLDIQLNYRAALAQLGAQVLFTDSATTVARFGDSGRLVWVKIWSQETAIAVSVVEEKAYKAAVRPAPAETLRGALEGRGRTALFLSFDFDRPTLKPENAPILAEVVRLLRDWPSLRLLVENHTDNIGPRPRNLELAAARAAAVRDALAAAGADPARINVVGIGPDRPITDNATSEARARNRRTVLIRQ
ncbi:MAG: OmpA family protein [Alphaproteobacteria bacterium]|nr:OmpA family protein [Alphaproteobacteria bacterium]